ncbi:MAG: 30S ribosomal protein S11 [Parcubacteria group bacterium]|nr:30S ribosomal protein S11 [Parcubacteria group bacterium]
MGKKKVIKQTEEEALKEGEIVEKALEKATAVKTPPAGGKKITRGRVYIRVSYNNTLITVTDSIGNVIAWSSAGSLGFRGPKKATPFAAARVAEAVIEKMKKSGLEELEVYVRGIGGGRESAIRTFVSKGLDIKLIKDVTPVPHNGPRQAKPRRV